MNALRNECRRASILVLLVLSVALMAVPAAAQVITGTIFGKITDTSGAGLPGVTVTMRNQDTGQVRTVVTDSSGSYRAPGLSLGAYEVRAELEGFQKTLRSGIALTVGREAAVNFKLAVAHVSETLVVRGEAPLVNTTESTVSHLVDEKQISELPLNGRDFSQLILLQPGVTMSRNSADSANVGRGIKISVAGARPNQNLFTLDGTDYNDALNNAPASAQGLMTGVETIKEFQVLTNTMSAEYGRASGGVFNVVTKAGTNDFHGSIFEFHRNDRFDALNYLDEEKPDFKRNQFGLSAGGPIVADRLFFFTSYEGLRETKGITNVSVVPDDNARNGILPGKTAAIRINPLILPYLNLFPRANGRNLGGGTAEYISVFNRASFQNFEMGRVDVNMSERDTAFVRFLNDKSRLDELVLFPTYPNLVENEKQVLTIEERHIASPTLINETRVGMNRSNPKEDINPVDAHRDVAFVPGKAFGQIAVTGLTEIGTDRNNPRNFSQKLYQFTDNVYWTLGRNRFKTGANLEHFRYDGFSDSRSRGRLRFSSVEDFLNGKTRDFELAKPGSDFERHYRQNLVGLFVQDDLQANQRLTMNMGLRWEFVTTPKERDGKVSNLRSINDPAVTVGGDLFKNPTYKNIAPRLGFAWDVTGNGKTALRGGGGVFYEQPLFYLYRSPIFRSLPYVDRGLVTRPTLPIDIGKVASGGAPDTEPMPYDLKSTYTTQYNLNLQHELPLQTVVSVGYMGSRGHNLFGQGDINLAIPQILPDGTQFWPAGSPRRNPNFGTVRSVLQGFHSRYNGLTFGLEKRRTAGLQAQLSYTYGKSMDNRSGAGGRLEFRNGQSRTFDPYNKDLDWGRSDFDVRHNVSMNASYDLPFGKNRFYGGWQINVIGTYASGVPFSPIIPGDPDRDGSSENPGRPDRVPGCNPSNVAGGRNADHWFNPQCFAYPTPGTRGNAKRNSLEGPDFKTVDLSLVKTTPIARSMQLQLRVEAFNLFNRANFDIPINDPDGSAVFDDRGNRRPDAGKIFELAGDGREVQFAVRLLF